MLIAGEEVGKGLTTWGRAAAAVAHPDVVDREGGRERESKRMRCRRRKEEGTGGGKRGRWCRRRTEEGTGWEAREVDEGWDRDVFLIKK